MSKHRHREQPKQPDVPVVEAPAPGAIEDEKPKATNVPNIGEPVSMPMLPVYPVF